MLAVTSHYKIKFKNKMLFYIVSATAASMANQRSACLATFATCRRNSDVAGAAINTCARNRTALLGRLKALSTNQQSINAAQGYHSSYAILKNRGVFLYACH